MGFDLYAGSFLPRVYDCLLPSFARTRMPSVRVPRRLDAAPILPGFELPCGLLLMN